MTQAGSFFHRLPGSNIFKIDFFLLKVDSVALGSGTWDLGVIRVILTLAVRCWPASGVHRPAHFPTRHWDHSCNWLHYRHNSTLAQETYRATLRRHYNIIYTHLFHRSSSVARGVVTRGALPERPPSWFEGLIRARAKLKISIASCKFFALFLGKLICYSNMFRNVIVSFNKTIWSY